MSARRLGDLVEDITVGWVGPMADKYVPSGVPFLRTLNVRPYSISTSDLMFISPEFHEKLRKSRLLPGDVVVARTGRPGTTAVMPEWLGEANCSDLVVIRPGEAVDARFLAYYLNSRTGKNLIHARNVGSVQKHFNIKAAKGLPFPATGIDEQRRIAAVLGALDDKIESNRKMNRTLEEMAQSIFKSWFVDFDHVPVSGRYESELGLIPEGWTVRSLYDSATYVNGAAYRNFHFSDEPGALPVVKIAELKQGVTGQTKHTTTELAEKYRINNREMLFSWSGNPDTSIDTFIWAGGPGWLNQHIFRVLPHEEYDWYFVYYLLRYLRPVFAEIARDKQTTGLGHVTARDMRRLRVIRPSGESLFDFNGAVGPLFERWYSNVVASRTLAELRDALLPKLISGEIRVPEAEKAVEAVA